MNSTYGKATEEAFTFVKFAQEKAQNGGYFNYHLTNSSTLARSISFSDVMLTYN